MTASHSRKKIYILAGILILIAAGIAAFKIGVLHFSFFRTVNAELWVMECRIRFDADNGPVKATLSLPYELPGYYLAATSQTPGYEFSVQERNNRIQAVWRAPGRKGPQTLSCQITFIPDASAKGAEEVPPEVPPRPHWANGQKLLAEQFLKSIDPDGKLPVRQFTEKLFKQIQKNDNPAVPILFADKRSGAPFIHTARKLLAMKGIPSREVEGVFLTDKRRRQSPVNQIEVYYDAEYHRYDPASGHLSSQKDFIPLRYGEDPLFEISGGHQPKLRFSALKTNISAAGLNRLRGSFIEHSWVMDIVGYELPISEQNVFKRLALLPLAVLLIVIVRNIIGLQSMGTFMPVLIALAFLETGLITGLIAFLLILTVGLAARTLLTNMNLLMVPRISAVVVIVILLMKVISVLSYALGFTQGQSITFFPLIILAWTIERASMVWEEDGARTMFRQLAVSLTACIPCYFLLNSAYLQYLFFSFQEFNLIILALILLLGTYTGYRLTELKRFKSLVTPCSDRF